MRYRFLILLSIWCLAGVLEGSEPAMRPYAMDWRGGAGALVDMSFLLDAPAGKDGPIRIKDGHLVKPDGERFRIWGVNVTGSACLPSQENAPAVAVHLARFGINCVRFHFLDASWSGNLFIEGRSDTRALDAGQLDRLDRFVWELKKRGIYTNLNLNVGRNFRKDDGVKDYEYLGLAKVVNYFDERIGELHREYARQLLTHRNPYTKTEYRHEPAVAIVELVNENSIVEAWFSDRLLGKNTRKRPGTWSDFTAWYAQELTRKYNEWLARTQSPERIEKLREQAGVEEGGAIPRLTRDQFRDAPALRFDTEAAFYIHLERAYFGGMYDYLKGELGVRALVVGTSDHNHSRSGYPLLSSTSLCDVVDGHVYWQHPHYGTDPKTGRRTITIKNTPMVEDPLHSTVVQLARSAVADKPYTVSETNHPFPSEYACEGIPILAAYAALHDWDGVFLYTFEHKAPSEWDARIPAPFELRPDPVKMTNIAACACLFLRADVRRAGETILHSYSPEQVRESIRYPYSEGPIFTPSLDRAAPLRHALQIAGFTKSTGSFAKISADSPIVSDTGELCWYHGEPRIGLVTVDTERSQALIGYVKQADVSLSNLSADVENAFCSIMLTTLDGKPIPEAGQLLLVTTARAANSGMKWNDKRTALLDWGSAPTTIEPVRGQVALRGLKAAGEIEVVPLDGAGKPLGKAAQVKVTAGGCLIPIGEPVTPWYLIRVER